MLAQFATVYGRRLASAGSLAVVRRGVQRRALPVAWCSGSAEGAAERPPRRRRRRNRSAAAAGEAEGTLLVDRSGLYTPGPLPDVRKRRGGDAAQAVPTDDAGSVSSDDESQLVQDLRALVHFL